jgi:erythrin-vacuolar iron transport family protein
MPWTLLSAASEKHSHHYAPHLTDGSGPPHFRAMRNFSDLTEREILALAIANEEEDGRIYLDIAEGLRTDYPGSANVFTEMAGEEGEHRRRLLDVYRAKFGEHIPLVRRQDVRGFIQHKPVWQMYPMNLKSVRLLAEDMETETQAFYRRAAARSEDVTIRKLLGDLADAEVEHEHRADQLVVENLPGDVRRAEDAHARQSFVLRVIQPGLAGLMDGSVSTLAPVFAAAFASGSTWQTFLVGLAASVGAGISMGFAEALSDNGSLTGRGAPLIRGAICGLMTTAGGIGHTLPFLIPWFWWAMAVAIAVVIVELGVISWVRWKYMDTPPLSATFQVAFGGALVFAVGILIGSS